MGVKAKPAIKKRFQAGIGSQEIGGGRHDAGIRLDQGRQGQREIIGLRALHVAEKALVTRPAGTNVELRKAHELQSPRPVELAVQFLDKKL